MKRIQPGRITKEWRAIRNEWIKKNPPNHQGYWVCYLCRQWVPEGGMELDHVEPKGSSGAHGNRLENLRPTHRRCNQLKGSSSYTGTGLVEEQDPVRTDKW